MMSTATLNSYEVQLRLVMERFGLEENEAREQLSRLDALSAAKSAEPGYFVDDVVDDRR